MKRFHLHIRTADLAASVDFYTRTLGAAPLLQREDYARWMLDDPPLNLALSHAGAQHAGVDHVGIQVDTDPQLNQWVAAMETAGQVVREDNTVCCYARANKGWAVDPQGVAWEAFHNLDQADEMGRSKARLSREEAGPCCVPAPAATSACCTPTSRRS